MDTSVSATTAAMNIELLWTGQFRGELKSSELSDGAQRHYVYGRRDNHHLELEIIVVVVAYLQWRAFIIHHQITMRCSDVNNFSQSSSSHWISA